ncbi:FAD-binding protein [Arenimonas daejeonensis]|uniref:FAD-binding protein n=1 Tax=Arenimonas daejeonensis TaxID=370777 RepID=UPI00223F00F4|nr:FAD-binding protein [Arenimonas daejeonensis]
MGPGAVGRRGGTRPRVRAVPSDRAGRAWHEPAAAGHRSPARRGCRARGRRWRAADAFVHPLADLAPRDVVARRIWSHQQAGGRAWLDATVLSPTAWRQFPTVRSLCLAHGFDPCTQPVPVTPAAHFHMGGIAVDAFGRSTLPGLYAVGEVACNGVHGANRLASNSLLEGVVSGRRLGALLRDVVPSPGRQGRSGWNVLPESAGEAALARLRDLLWRSLGPVREETTMCRAVAEIRADHALATSWQAQLAGRLLQAARARQLSLGAHHRGDAPRIDSIPQRIATLAYGEIVDGSQTQRRRVMKESRIPPRKSP